MTAAAPKRIRPRIAQWLRRLANWVDPASTPVDFSKIAAVTLLTDELTQAEWDALGDGRIHWFGQGPKL